MAKLKRVLVIGGMLLLLAGLLGLCASGRPRVVDEYMTYFQAQTYLHEGNFSIPQGLVFKNAYGKIGVDGKPYAPYGLLHAWLLAPWLRAGEVLEQWAEIPLEWRHFSSAWAGGFFSVLCLALLGCAMTAFALKQGLEPSRSCYWAFSLLFTTPLWTLAGTFFSEPLSTLILFTAAGFYLCAGCEENEDKRICSLALCSLLLGLNLWIRFTSVIYSAVFTACACFSLRHKKNAGLKALLVFVLIQMLLGAALLLKNKIIYGNWLDMGYPDHAEAGKALNGFTTPLGYGLSVFLFSPGKSVLIYAPLILACFVGIWQARKENPERAALSAGVFFATLFFYSKYAGFEGGYCYGPRYFLAVLPILWLGLLPLLSKNRGMIYLAVLDLFGFLVNLPAKLTSFLEEQVGGKKYFDAAFHYQWDHAAFLEQWKLVFKYLRLTVRGEYFQTALGNGWDFGWLFWLKAGARPEAVSAVLLVSTAVFGLGVVLLTAGFKLQTRK